MTEESVPVTLVHEKKKIKLIDTPGTGNADNYKELELGRLDSLKDERQFAYSEPQIEQILVA